jgi:hypothetical protein
MIPLCENCESKSRFLINGTEAVCVEHLAWAIEMAAKRRPVTVEVIVYER